MASDVRPRTRVRATTVLCAAALVLSALTSCAPSSSSDYTGTWTSAHPAGTSLDLKDGGDLTGNDGCNTLTGTWTESKGTVTFSGVASTRKACAGVDAWLAHAASARSDGDTLNVYDSGGTQIGVLDRQ